MKAIKKAIRTKVAIGISFMMAPCLLVLVILTVSSATDTTTTMLAAQKAEGFLMAYQNSVNLYSETNCDFCEILATYVLESKDLDKYDSQLMQSIQDYCKSQGDSVDMEDFVKSKTDYDYLLQLYRNSYQELIRTEVTTSGAIKFFYNCYFPIAYDATTTTTTSGSSPAATPQPNKISVSYSDDFLDNRSFESLTFHDGNDIMCPEGTPVIAVESGTLENIGWNSAGGWRIGIRSDDGTRYWYYAHMRRIHPYLTTLKKGDRVIGGQFIGYVGSTGYSSKLADNTIPDPGTLTNPDAVDKQFVDHLHFGLQVKFSSDGQEQEQWIDPYPVLKFLENNRVSVTQTAKAGEPDPKTEDYTATTKTVDQRVFAIFDKKKEDVPK